MAKVALILPSSVIITFLHTSKSTRPMGNDRDCGKDGYVNTSVKKSCAGTAPVIVRDSQGCVMHAWKPSSYAAQAATPHARDATALSVMIKA